MDHGIEHFGSGNRVHFAEQHAVGSGPSDHIPQLVEQSDLSAVNITVRTGG